MTPREVLVAAKALIDTPEKWCQGVITTQHRMCAAHAIRLALGSDAGWSYEELHATAPYQALLHTARFRRNPEQRRVYEYNDSHTHEQVMAWFDRAIAVAEGGES